MRVIATILVLILGIIYYPLNMLYMKLQKLYLPLRKKDKILFFAIAPFYWTFVLIVFIISYPFEWISDFAAH